MKRIIGTLLVFLASAVHAQTPNMGGMVPSWASPPPLNLTGSINFGAGTDNGPSNSSIYGVVSASGICSNATQCYLNQFNITDNVDASAAASGLIGWYFVDHLGTSAKKGRITGYFEQDVSSTPATAGNYTALEAFAHSSVNIGTNSLFGLNVVAQGAATFTGAQIVGNETDIRALSGATYNDFIGQQNVIVSTHAQVGARTNIGYTVTSQSNSTPMFSALYADGTYTGWPASDSTTSVFKCIPHAASGACPSIAAGIDLTKYAAIAGNAFASPGFSVDGSGNITVTSCSGCSGGGGGGTPADYISGSWYQPNHELVLAGGSGASAANTLYCIFGGVPSNVTIKTLGAKVTSGSSGNMQMAVYSVSGGTLTLVDSTANISTTSPANVTGAVANTTDLLSSTTLYAWCANFNATPTFATFALTGGGAAARIGTTSVANAITGSVIIGKSIAQTFGTWPGTLTLSAMSDVITGVAPQVGFQVN